MTFNPITQPVDYILLANRRSPGLAVVSNASSPRRWDVRRGYALSGARVVYRGNDLARPVVTLRLLSEDDFSDWHDWRSLLDRPSPGPSIRSAITTIEIRRALLRGARPMDIWHPILEDLGISAVVVEDVAQPVQVADGEWNVEIKFIEYRRPIRTLQTAEAPQERPTDPVDQEIERLTAQVGSLVSRLNEP